MGGQTSKGVVPRLGERSTYEVVNIFVLEDGDNEAGNGEVVSDDLPVD